MDFEVYRTSQNYNSDALRCAQVRDITREDILAVANRYDDARYTVISGKLRENNPKTNLPRLFDQVRFKERNEFTLLRKREARSLLRLSEQATTDIICETARSYPNLDDLLKKAIGPDVIRTSRLINVKTASRRFEYDDITEVYELALNGSADEVSQFLVNICSLEKRRRYSFRYDSSTTYALLLALYAEGIAMLPFGIWRDISLCEKVANQAYLDLDGLDHLLNIEHLQDLQLLTFDAEKKLGSRYGPQARRLLQSLTLTTFSTVKNLDPEEIISAIASYVSAPNFESKTYDAKNNALKLIRDSLNVLKDRISNLGQPADSRRGIAIARLAERGTVPNGISVRAGKNELRGTFSFLAAANHDLTGWIEPLRNFVNTSSNIRKVSLSSPLITFCDWLVLHGQDITEPRKLLQTDVLRSDGSSSRTTLLNYLHDSYDEESSIPARAYGAARAFFDWWQPLHDPEAANPLPERHQPRTSEYLGKTSKEGLPVRIIELMKGIILENDYKFCKGIADDYVIRTNASGEETRVWSPVRAVSLYTMLTLPLRSIQARKLDSGEFDEVIFDESKWAFVENPRGVKRRRQSVFRHFVDFGADSAGFIGLYVNSNKSDSLSRSKRLGYEIKWENKPLIRSLCMLRDWQIKYNPVGRLIGINEVAEHALHAPEEAAKRMPKFAFLFRDPSSIRSSSLDPVSHSRLSSFFLLILEEAERRLNDDGYPIQFIKKRYPSGRPKEAHFTLHSLRVSGITNFAEFGVPLNVLTEFLAGHSSILMNIWYQKLGFQTVSSVIQTAHSLMSPDAVEGQMRRWQAEFTAVVQGKEVPSSQIGEMIIAEGEVAGQIDRISPELWSIALDGFCPNGRTLCHEGGPRIGTKGWTRATPVQGGHGNCPRCRFWATGPMFLAGQVIAANLLLYNVQEKGRRLEQVNDDLTNAQSRGQLSEVEAVRSAIEKLSIDIENDLQTWVSRYVLIEKSLDKMDEAEKSDVFQFVTSKEATVELSDLRDIDQDREKGSRIVFSQAGEFGLLEFVNQVCEVFPEVDIPSARYKKSMLLDRMIDREGGKAFFFSLNDREALRVGNQLTSFLAKATSYTDLSRLLAGDRTLRDFSLGSVSKLLSEINDPVTVSEKNKPLIQIVRSE